MQISGVNTNSAHTPSPNSPQSASIDQKIEKLEDRKRKIEEDLTIRSTNPDPRAAQGDNAANSAVNRRILKQIEKQIETLEQRRDGANTRSTPDSNSVKRPASEGKDQFAGRCIDMFA